MPIWFRRDAHLMLMSCPSDFNIGIRTLEYKKLEKAYKALAERLSLMNTQTYASSKSLKGIDRKKVLKGKHDDKDDVIADGNPCTS